MFDHGSNVWQIHNVRHTKVSTLPLSSILTLLSAIVFQSIAFKIFIIFEKSETIIYGLEE